MRKATGISLGFLLVAGGGAYFVGRSIQRNKLYKQISAKIGVSSANLSSYDDWFDPNYYKDKTGKSENYATVNSSQLLQWADSIDDAFGYWNDDEEQIYAVFRAVPDGVALSQLSELYGTRHESDLKEDINGLDKDEVVKVANILASKESYRPVAVN